MLLEAPGGSFQTTVARGVEAKSGTAKFRVSAELGALLDGGTMGSTAGP